MGSSFIFVLALWAGLSQVEISQTDRGPYTAELLSIDGGSIRVRSQGQESQISVDQLRSLRFAESTPTAATPAPQQVVLTDGSRLGCSQVTSDPQLSQLQLPFGSKLELPNEHLLHLQLQPLNESQQTQWTAMTQSRIAGDNLVLIRSPEALELLEGIVLGISAEAVRFEFGGQSIDAPRVKLAGVRFFHPGQPAIDSEKLAAIVHDRAGNRWMAAGIQAEAGSADVELHLLCGARIRLPREQLAEMDFSAGSMQFLAEIEPTQTSAPLGMALGSKIAGADKLFGARTADLRRPGGLSLGPSLEFLGNGTIVYRVPQGFSRLKGDVELRPTGSRFTPCQVTVRVENKVVWQEQLQELGKRFPLDVPLESDARVQLEVTTEGSTPVGNVVLWHDLRFVK